MGDTPAGLAYLGSMLGMILLQNAADVLVFQGEGHLFARMSQGHVAAAAGKQICQCERRLGLSRDKTDLRDPLGFQLLQTLGGAVQQGRNAPMRIRLRMRIMVFFIRFPPCGYLWYVRTFIAVRDGGTM